jgi:hypothetical protein
MALLLGSNAEGKIKKIHYREPQIGTPVSLPGYKLRFGKSMHKQEQRSPQDDHRDAINAAVDQALERSYLQLAMAANIYLRHNLVKEASDLQQSLVDVRKDPAQRAEQRHASS